MDFLKKNKPVAIGIGIILIILVVFLVRGKNDKSAKGDEKVVATGRRGRRGSSTKKPATKKKKVKSRKKNKGKKVAGKKAPRINLKLTIKDIPQINNKELIVAREKGELIGNFDYTFKYNPYEDWEVRIYLSDTDGDGIPDKEDPDIDDDGYSNEQEKLAGTDPYNYRSHPVESEEDEKIENAEQNDSKIEMSDEEKRKLTEEKAEEDEGERWNTVVKNYNYKGTMGMKNTRLAIFKDSTTEDVLLRRINEEIPDTKYKVVKIKTNSVVLLDTKSGKEKELFSKTEAKEKSSGNAPTGNLTPASTTQNNNQAKAGKATAPPPKAASAPSGELPPLPIAK